MSLLFAAIGILLLFIAENAARKAKQFNYSKTPAAITGALGALALVVAVWPFVF